MLRATKPAAFRDRERNFEITAAYGPWRTERLLVVADGWDEEEWDVLAKQATAHGRLPACAGAIAWRLEAFYDCGAWKPTMTDDHPSDQETCRWGPRRAPNSRTARRQRLQLSCRSFAARDTDRTRRPTRMPAIALADRNGLYGVARFHTMAKKCGVKAHIGAEIAVILRQPAHTAILVAASMPR
jgi:hypothetical protein